MQICEEASLNVHKLWSRILTGVGAIAMLVGAVDPLEGSVVILAGSGLVLLGTFLGNTDRRVSMDWLWVFGLIVLGVVAMFVLSAFGGIGGKHRHSMWWGPLLLPYPIGWVTGIVSLASRVIRNVRHRHSNRGSGATDILNRIILTSALVLTALSTSGCALLVRGINNTGPRLGSGGQKMGPYPATRMEAYTIAHTPVGVCKEGPFYLPCVAYWAADLPVSFVIDSCFLPVDLAPTK